MATATETQRDLVKLWRAWKTAHQMCADRGYQIAPHELSLSLPDFTSKYTNPDNTPNRVAMNFSANPSLPALEKHTPLPTPSHPNPQPAMGTIWVEFSGTTKGVGIAEFRKFCHNVAERNFRTGILIAAGNITPAALKIIPECLPEQIIETFHEQDLLVNVTLHELVPRHVLLSHGEKKALLERYRVKDSQLPRIQVADPVARYLGLRRGQVVKIVRRSETAGRYASYRYVI